MITCAKCGHQSKTQQYMHYKISIPVAKCSNCGCVVAKVDMQLINKGAKS